MPPLTPLKRHRLERDVPQLVVATRAGIPRARMSELECGYAEPRPDELERIARVLGVPVSDLRRDTVG
jgi:transcriptional regulator with XRE-family HTH domain